MASTFSESILVKTNPETAFEQWTKPANIPSYMEAIEEVVSEGEDRLRWRMTAEDGTQLEWVTDTTRSEPPNRFAWNTVEGDINSSGQVTFHQVGDGQTEITMMMNFAEKDDPQAAAAFGDPRQQVVQTLRGFKAFVEGR